MLQTTDTIECLDDPCWFASTVFSVCDQPKPLLFDSVREELLETLQEEKLVIGRYPRRYGKTTVLAGYALHQALFGKHVWYVSNSTTLQLEFMKLVGYASRQLPWELTIQERFDYLTINDGTIGTTNLSINKMRGSFVNVVLIDDVTVTKNNVVQFADFVIHVEQVLKAQVVIVGTFTPSTPFVGDLWSKSREESSEWVSLPSKQEMEKVNAMLSIIGEQYARDFRG